MHELNLRATYYIRMGEMKTLRTQLCVEYQPADSKSMTPPARADSRPQEPRPPTRADSKAREPCFRPAKNRDSTLTR